MEEEAWFVDPVTLCEPEEPVLASDGRVYDADTLRHLVAVATEEGRPPTSPITREVLRPLVFPVFEEGKAWRLYHAPAASARVGVDWIKGGDSDPAVAVFLANLMAEGPPGTTRLALDLCLADGNRILGWDPDPVVQGWARRLARALKVGAMFVNPEVLCCAHPVFIKDNGKAVVSEDTLETHFVACQSLWAK